MEMSEHIDGQGTATRLPASVTLWDRFVCGGGGAVIAGGAFAFLGMGELSLIPALAGGCIAAYLSPEIRGKFIDRAPAPEGVSGRGDKLRFWITGERSLPVDEQTDVTEQAQPHEDAPVTQVLPLEEDDLMETLQPKSTFFDDDFTDEEADLGLAQIMAPARPVEFRAESIIGMNPRRRLVMAENFQPDANDPLATGVAAFGIPGSGKTTVIVRFMEQYVEQYHLPFVVFDSQGDFKSLVESGFCPRGVIATPENLPSMASVVKHGLQVVIDLSEWREEGKVEMSIELAAQLIATTIRSLMAAQKAIAPHSRIPCLVGLDEAQLWVPEGASGFMSKETSQQIKTAVMGLATTGRKLGVVPFIAGPRIAQIDKDAIAGIETRLFGKADLDNDIKRYRDYIPVREVTDQQLRQLGKGDLIVCMHGQRLLVHFYNRATVHTSHTPRVSQSLARFASSLPPEAIAQIAQVNSRVEERNTDALPTQARRHVTTSSYDLHRQRLASRKVPVYARDRQPAMGKVPETPRVEDDPESGLTRDERSVLEAYRSGLKTGNAIAAETGISSTRVNQALNRLARLDLIDWQPRKV